MADDILQDAFMRLLLKDPRAPNEAALRGYLYRTAESILVDRWRQRQRESNRDRAAADQDQSLVQPEFDGGVDRAFRELSSQQRSLLWMAYVEELDHREIAAAVAVKEKSVRVLLSRARKAFARVLSRLGLSPEVADAN